MVGDGNLDGGPQESWREAGSRHAGERLRRRQAHWRGGQRLRHGAGGEIGGRRRARVVGAGNGLWQIKRGGTEEDDTGIVGCAFGCFVFAETVHHPTNSFQI
jgi:hypothetical protein